MSKLLMISTDGHATLPLEGFRPYLDPQFRQAFDDTLGPEADADVDFFAVLDPEFAKSYRARFYDNNAIDGRHDPDLRVKLLASQGIVGEMIFPDGAPFGAGGLGSAIKPYATDLLLAGARAYNRWIVDFTSGHPGLGAQAIVVLEDVDEAVKDVYWAKEHGVKGLYMRGMDSKLPLYWDPMYEPFWAACAETGLPMNFHGGTGGPKWRSDEFIVPDLPYSVRSRIATQEFVFWAQRPLWFLLWSGVFERHPSIKMVITETYSHWASGLIASMDHNWHNSFFDNSLRETVPLPPSEYFERNVMLGASICAKGELNESNVYRHKLMFGADFPHPESTFPFTAEYLRATVGASNMTEAEIRAYMGETAAAYFGFDLDVLRPMADEHGLTVEQITEPLPFEEEWRLFKHHDVNRPTTRLTYEDPVVTGPR